MFSCDGMGMVWKGRGFVVMGRYWVLLFFLVFMICLGLSWEIWKFKVFDIERFRFGILGLHNVIGIYA